MMQVCLPSDCFYKLEAINKHPGQSGVFVIRKQRSAQEFEQDTLLLGSLLKFLHFVKGQLVFVEG